MERRNTWRSLQEPALHLRRKLSPHAIQCDFLGYGDTQKGCICHNPVSNRIFVSLNVVIIEYIPYFLPAKSSSNYLSFLLIFSSILMPPLPNKFLQGNVYRTNLSNPFLRKTPLWSLFIIPHGSQAPDQYSFRLELLKFRCKTGGFANETKSGFALWKWRVHTLSMCISEIG